MTFASPYFDLLKDRINLNPIPFTERGSRLLVTRRNDHLAVHLAERWVKRENHLAAYRRRPPILDELRFTDAQGQPLPMLITSFPHCLEMDTPLGRFSLTFQDIETLLLRLPAARFGVSFLANLDQAQPDRRGGVLRLTGNIRRNMAYTTNARILEHTIAPFGESSQRVSMLLDANEGSALLVNITPRLGFNRYIPPVDEVFQAAARRWHDWFASVPPVLDDYREAYLFAWWVMRAGLISTRYYTTREAMTPSKAYYVGVWQWDAFFHAIAYRHIDPRLAQDQLRILLDHQREDGMIPDAVHDEGTVTHLDYPVDADVTKPPLLAWAAWKLHEFAPDLEFLQEIYEPLVRWNRWWFEKNDLDGNGLCEYQHPFSSGLDDSPLWDEGMPVESPDLNTYLCLQQEALARIARAIGEQEAARGWEEQAQALAERMLQHMYDPQAGLFWARRLVVPSGGAAASTIQSRIVAVRTPFNLLPLITGRLPANVNRRLVAHLTDERQFWPRFPVPTVALDDPHYNPNQMWRGPTWLNVNYLLIEGLRRSGYAEIAAELRRRTLELVAGQKDIYEYYHPETGANPPNAASTFGWSSALFIDLAIQVSQEQAHPPGRTEADAR